MTNIIKHIILQCAWGLAIVKLSNKLKNKGFTIIEVLCSLSILSMLFSYIIFFELNNIRTKKYIEVKNENIKLLEASVSELSNNCSYNDLLALYNSKQIYICKDKLNFDSIMNYDIKSNVTEDLVNEEPYIILSFDKDKVIKVTATLYFKFINKEERIKWEFYKGNY